MTLLILAYLAGVLTIASPCILPILPFVLARADVPFRRGGLPLLAGLAVAFAAVASLASVAGGWAVEANSTGRTIALVLVALFGLAMLLPALATQLARPLVALGNRLADEAGRHRMLNGATTGSSMLLGVATGLLWAPCAGPVLGLILTGAALHGPGLTTSLLLLGYGLGAATSLAAGVVLGRRLSAALRPWVRWEAPMRRTLGVAVMAGAATIWLGFDTGTLTRWSSAGTDAVERTLITTLQSAPTLAMGSAAHATPPPLSGPLRSLLTAGRWLNTPPLGEGDLQGKVVVVNFWTYSCINCLRALPHVRAWAAKYADQGLVVIGVHTPEFAFEKDLANVRKAVGALGIGYPVAIDNDFRIWRDFSNQAWPALYFVGADGRVRHRVLGEGSYGESERLIRQLLSEAGGPSASGAAAAVAVAAQGAQAAADPGNLRSGETYVGYGQGRDFLSPGGVRKDEPASYQAASALPLNRWSLAGVWTIGEEFATLDGAPGRIAYRFHARDLHLVLAPSLEGRPVRFRITIDGAAPGADHGADVDADGWGSVREGRLYQLVRQTGAVADRTFEIEFLDTGVRAYAFTFG